MAIIRRNTLCSFFLEVVRVSFCVIITWAVKAKQLFYTSSAVSCFLILDTKTRLIRLYLFVCFSQVIPNKYDHSLDEKDLTVDDWKRKYLFKNPLLLISDIWSASKIRTFSYFQSGVINANSYLSQSPFFKFILIISDRLFRRGVNGLFAKVLSRLTYETKRAL